MRDCSDSIVGSVVSSKTNRADSILEPLLKQYRHHGKPITVSFRDIVPWITYNSDRYTHQIHSYPARVIPHIPHLFVTSKLLSQRGDTVADPFCGSGTVLLESILAGRNAVGADINPLARLLSKVKLTPVSPARLAATYERFHTSSADCEAADVVNRDYWFSERIAAEITEILGRLASLPETSAKDVFLVSFSAMLRKLSYADPRVSVPVRQNPSRYPRGHPFRKAAIRRLAELKHLKASDLFETTLEKNVDRASALFEHRHELGALQLLANDALDLSGIATASVSLVVTSPPYLGAQKYIRASEFSLGWLGLAASSELRGLESKSVGREHYRKAELSQLPKTGLKEADRLIDQVAKNNPLRAKIAAQYLMDMAAAIKETHRILRPGGHLVLVAGPNRLCGLNFGTPEFLLGYARKIGFSDKLVIKDHIKSRGLMTRRNTTAGMIPTEWVLLLQR